MTCVLNIWCLGVGWDKFGWEVLLLEEGKVCSCVYWTNGYSVGEAGAPMSSVGQKYNRIGYITGTHVSIWLGWAFPKAVSRL